MSPLPPSTPKSVELGLSSHHGFQEKEDLPCGEGAELVKEIQPQFKEVAFSQQMKAELQAWELNECMKYEKAHDKIPWFQLGEDDVESVKETDPQVKEVSRFKFRKAHEQVLKFQPGEDAESVKEVQPQAKEVLSFSQQKQAELDEWLKFRKAHAQVPKFQPVEDAESVKEIHPEAKEVSAHCQHKQAELDEWFKFRKAHEDPKDLVKIVTDLFDIDNTPDHDKVAPVADQLVAGVSSWRKKNKRSGRSFKSISY